MKRVLQWFVLPCLVASTACATWPAELRLWEDEKLMRLAVCTAQRPKSREDGVKCMGPNYSRDLGDKASATVHLWLAHLPDGRANK